MKRRDVIESDRNAVDDKESDKPYDAGQGNDRRNFAWVQGRWRLHFEVDLVRLDTAQQHKSCKSKAIVSHGISIYLAGPWT